MKKSQPQPDQKAPPSAAKRNKSAPKDSWNDVASWYDEAIEDGQSYQKQVIMPALLRRIGELKDKKVLDVACGSGLFSVAFAQKGADVTGIDIGVDLLAAAQKRISSEQKINVRFVEKSATDLMGFGSFDHVVCVLAVQNMAQADEAIAGMLEVLAPGGTLHIVLNHPAFRIPKHSAWQQVAGTEQGKMKKVVRIMDMYMTEQAQAMDMHPGSPGSAQTMSYHRPLQWFFKQITNRGGAVTRLEEWISDRESQAGPWKVAEDKARKEFPLFLYVEAKKI